MSPSAVNYFLILDLVFPFDCLHLISIGYSLAIFQEKVHFVVSVDAFFSYIYKFIELVIIIEAMLLNIY